MQTGHFRTILLLAVVVLPSVTTWAQPSPVWETTVSVTSQLEGADDMVVDAEGNSIVVGSLPVEGDFYVLKFDASGSLLWSRVIGGSGLDVATGLALDAAGDIYLSGRTASSDFPTLLAYQAVKNGPSDAFLMKLSGADGTTLFSTYFGGSKSEWGWDVAIGPDGSIYLTGATDSADLETVDPIQDGLTLLQCFCRDAFVTRFTPMADAVLFSTYLGGTFDDEAHEIEVDAAGNIYFAGHTRSADWPTQNAQQPVVGGGMFDVFTAKINADNTLGYSTYLGGEDWDIIKGMDIDGDGNVYVAGSTRSIFYPTTPGAFQQQFVGGINACEVPFGQEHNCFDMFVTKLDLDGALIYSTYIGGHSEDEPRNLVVDAVGRAHVIGYTFSNDFPLAAPFGTVVTMQLDADGSDLNYLLTHETPGSNAGSALAVTGNDLFIATSVGLPYDTYIEKLSSTASGDIDEDGDVDLDDMMLFSQCLTGPDLPNGNCPMDQFLQSDLDGDKDVDLSDFALFQVAFAP